MGSGNKSTITGGGSTIVITAVALSVILSVGATLVIYTLVSGEPDGQLPEAGPERTASHASPPKAGPAIPGLTELREKLRAADADRARLRTRLEQQAAEIADLKKRMNATRAGSLEPQLVDPAEVRSAALKALTESHPIGAQFAVHDAVRDLVRLGDNAVPAVAALLKSGASHSYGGGFSTSGGMVRSYAHSRMALIDVLRQIGTPLATRELIASVAAVDAPNDYAMLFMLCSSTRQPAMTAGLTELVPAVIRRLSRDDVGEREEAWAQRSLSSWIVKQNLQAMAPALANLIEQRTVSERDVSGYGEALVEVAPGEAVMMVKRLAAKKDGMDAVNRFITTHSRRRLTLTQQVHFYEKLFDSVPLDSQGRIRAYMRMSTRPPRGVEGSAARLDDLRRMKAFLDTRAAIETEPKPRQFLESTRERLEKVLEREERRARK